MTFNKITPYITEEIIKIIGRNFVHTQADLMEKYSHDETEDLRFLPELVALPSNAEEISQIVTLCNQHHIPVTPRGGGTGLSGGALPVQAGIVLSLERLNQILKIDEQNLQAIVEPGVITQVFQEAVIDRGLFYPPDPSSRGSCFLGGNLAESAGGPKAVKYGVTKDYVLNLEVVLPTGEIIWTGANVLKNATGYNLTQLMVGSEGTLGIITKIVFRLIPYPTKSLTMLVPFDDAENACDAVSRLFREGITPSALEFMEREALIWASKHLNQDLEISDSTRAHLLIEVDGNDLEALYLDCEKISTILQNAGSGDVLLADTAAQKEQLWKLRRNVAEAVKSQSVYKEEDTVVPRFHLAKLLTGVKSIGAQYGFKSVCYGHAGDGNLHINIIKGAMSDEDWNKKIPLGIREIFKLCVNLGGTISGEHGIGWVQRPYMDIAFNDVQLNLMRGIKKLFDPKGIMNPGKIF